MRKSANKDRVHVSPGLASGEGGRVGHRTVCQCHVLVLGLLLAGTNLE